jgi:hypothetical protein
MNAIRSIFAAFTNLAASVNALASVIDGAAAKLRMQLAAESDPPALRRGEVEGAEAETTLAANGKGRKAKATA